MALILIVTDDRATGSLVQMLVRGMDHEAELVSDGSAALKQMAIAAFDLVISDVHMKPMGGLELLEKAKAQYPQTRVVLFSADANPDLRTKAKQLGAVDFLAKPIQIDRLKKVLDRASAPAPAAPDPTPAAAPAGTPAAPSRSPSQQEFSAEDFETLVHPFFPGPGLKVVRQRLAWVAQARSHVLIDARPGVLSREVLEAFHHYSPYASGSLRITNLETANVDEIRARWTQDGTGWLKEMAGGTIVLLALDAMPLDVQACLADLVRTEFRARIIATIRGDPDELVSEKRLHDGLYFRLALFSTRVAPLAEASERVPELLADSVAASKGWMGAGPPLIDREARTALSAYSWPQNYYELRRLADQLASRLEPGHSIRLDHLPDAVAAAHWPSLADHLRAAATTYIRRVQRTQPDMEKAAAVLGVRSSALSRHMEDSNEPVFSLDLDRAPKLRETAAPFVAPFTTAPFATSTPTPDAATDKRQPIIERVLVIAANELARASLAGQLAASNRDVVDVTDALGAVSAIKMSRQPFEFVLVVPPCSLFEPVELGRQLARLAPSAGLALLDKAAAASGERGPFHVVRGRPETPVELVEVLALLRKRAREAKSAVWQ